MRTAKFCLLLVPLLLLFSYVSPVSAHRMLITEEGDYLRITYDNNTPTSNATVVLLGEGDRVLWEGNADENGQIKPEIKRFARIEASDGLGHRAVYIPGEVQREIPRPLAAAIGVSFFLFIASLANYVTKKKLHNNL